jgi:integrase
MGLGSAHDISLQEARIRAQEARRLRADGIDPLEARRYRQLAAAMETAKALTFEKASSLFIDAQKPGWRNKKHGDQWAATLKTYAFPTLGNMPVQAVDTAMVFAVLQPIWNTRTETAARVRSRIERILDWSTSHGYRTGENPARWRGHLNNMLPPPAKVARVKHHPALPYSEIRNFMQALRCQSGDAAEALELLILTASRTGEIIGARWEEFDLARKHWIVPGDRMKAGREHRVALNQAAIEILTKRQASVRDQTFVFPGKPGKSISNGAILMLLERMGRGDITAHGFRSTFRDWVAEQTHFPGEVAELALAHAVSDKVEAAYRRGDQLAKRSKLMEAWATFLLSQPKSATVIPLNRQRALKK